MVDHFRNFIFVNIVASLLGQHNLAYKKAYARQSSTYIVKVRSYHAYNGRYYGQLFRDAVEDATLVESAILLHLWWHWHE